MHKQEYSYRKFALTSNLCKLNLNMRIVIYSAYQFSNMNNFAYNKDILKIKKLLESWLSWVLN